MERLLLIVACSVIPTGALLRGVPFEVYGPPELDVRSGIPSANHLLSGALAPFGLQLPVVDSDRRSSRPVPPPPPVLPPRAPLTLPAFLGSLPAFLGPLSAPLSPPLPLPAFLGPLPAPLSPAPPSSAPLLLSDARGQYSVGFEEPSGTRVREQGRLVSVDGGWEYVLAKRGSFGYTSPEGVAVRVDWEADAGGFRVLSASP